MLGDSARAYVTFQPCFHRLSKDIQPGPEVSQECELTTNIISTDGICTMWNITRLHHVSTSSTNLVHLNCPAIFICGYVQAVLILASSLLR